MTTKILIVDDEPGVRFMLKTVLTTYGNFKNIEEAENGRLFSSKDALKPEPKILSLSRLIIKNLLKELRRFWKLNEKI